MNWLDVVLSLAMIVTFVVALLVFAYKIIKVRDRDTERSEYDEND